MFSSELTANSSITVLIRLVTAETKSSVHTLNLAKMQNQLLNVSPVRSFPQKACQAALQGYPKTAHAAACQRGLKGHHN
jgi:hypothetical protein